MINLGARNRTRTRGGFKTRPHSELQEAEGSPERICQMVERAVKGMLEKGTPCQRGVLKRLLPHFPRCRPDKLADEMATTWLWVAYRKIQEECG